ncbi:hypothetical protein [Microbulbifer guangxiensis]|nr:hypothetical protein [Microbulbifer guangxiensis]
MHDKVHCLSFVTPAQAGVQVPRRFDAAPGLVPLPLDTGLRRYDE